MGINIENYEAWFLDYAEGNLNEQQVADLMLFLVQHPELKEELEEDFGSVELPTESVVLPNKEALKQGGAIVSVSNIDDFLIAELEGTLTQEELMSLQLFLQQNPGFQKDQVLFQKTRLQADLNIQYADKEGLKRRKAVVFPLYMRYIAAAAVLIFAIFLFYQRVPNTEGPIIVNIDNKDTAATQLAVEPLEKSSGRPSDDLAIDTSATQASTEVVLAVERPSSKNASQDGFVKEVVVRKHEPVLRQGQQDDFQKVAAERTPEQKTLQPDAKLQKYLPVPDALPDTMAMAAVDDRQNGDVSRPSQPGMTVWEYAGRQIKENVLDEENVADGRIRESDVANAFSKGVDKVSKREVDFKDRSSKERVSYGVSIGKFGFSRTKSRKK